MVNPEDSGHASAASGHLVRVALVHAVPVAMAPIEQAFQCHWPEAERANLLDDTLALDLERAGALTPALAERILGLARHAVVIGARGVLFTCSSFGDAIDAAAALLAVPVLKPNQAMFEAALARGTHIGMLATFAPAVAPMEQEFHALARRQGRDATIETVCVPGAMAAARAGDIATHNRLVAEAAGRLVACDAVMLAQFSVASAQDAVQQVLDRAGGPKGGAPVLSAPAEAVAALRRAVGQAAAPA